MIELIRGVAALAVVLFHYSDAILPTITGAPGYQIFHYGKHGVQMFFVISGFVLPYSMLRSGYQLHDLGRFMGRRYLRIAPLAYISAILMIAYHALAYIMLGRPVDSADWPGVNLNSILGNLVFHPELFGSNWFNFVFWTLLVEFQFYFLIALVLPWVTDRSKQWRTVIIIALILLTRFWSVTPLFHHISYFMLGLVVFLVRQERLDRNTGVLMAFACIAMASSYGAWAPVLMGTAAAAAIYWAMDRGTRWGDRAGELSYSIYLMHVPLGYFAESALKRVTGIHETMGGKAALLVLYTVIAIAGSAVFQRVVERPLLRYLKRTSARRSPATGLGATAPLNAERP